jgi:acyl carrier protein
LINILSSEEQIMAVDRTGEVEEVLRKTVARILRKENITLNPETSFKEIGADSLDIVQVMVALEEEFDIELVDEEMKELGSLGEFMDYVKNKVSEKS